MKNEIKRGGTIFGYLVAIGIQFLAIWIIQKLPNWVNFLNGSYPAVMWLIIIGAAANIIVNFIYIFYDYRPFKSLLQFIINLYSFIVTYSIYIIFPFNFSSYNTNWDLIVRIFLIVAMVGIAIASIVEFVKIFVPKKEKHD